MGPVYAVKGWLPTRKWLAATATGAAGLLILFVNQEWVLNGVTEIALITFVCQRVVAYVLPNDATPGGAPDASVSAERPPARRSRLRRPARKG